MTWEVERRGAVVIATHRNPPMNYLTAAGAARMGALALGLVHELADDARERAIEVAEELASLSPTSMAMVKRAVYQGMDLPLASALRIESDALFHVRLSPEVMETMRAYVQVPYEERRDWLEAAPGRRGRR